MYTDASHDPETGVYGWAAWIRVGPLPPFVVSGTGEATGSCQAEGLAIHHTAQALIRQRLGLHQVISFYCDSKPAMSAVRREVRRRLRRKVKANKVLFHHVQAHCGARSPSSAVNTLCDRIAKRKMRSARDAIIGGCL